MLPTRLRLSRGTLNQIFIVIRNMFVVAYDDQNLKVLYQTKIMIRQKMIKITTRKNTINQTLYKILYLDITFP